MEWSEFIFHKEEEKDVREENVGKIRGAKFAENGSDEIVRQGIERVTISSDIRRIPASFLVTNLFGGEISHSLQTSHVHVFNNSRVTKQQNVKRNHIKFHEILKI